MLLNLKPSELPALLAAMDIALQAASGYNVRTHPGREVISGHWAEFNNLHAHIKGLEAQREFCMTHPTKKGRLYIHVGIDKDVHARLQAHLIKQGGGVIRSGALGALVESAIVQYLTPCERGDAVEDQTT